MPALLWLTENYPPQRGGMAQSCDRIIDGLRNKGFTIEIIHFTNRGGNFQRKQQQNGGYTAIAFEDSEAHLLNMAWNYISTLGKFDYIICFGGYLSMIGAPVFAKWADTKLITFLRGNDFDTAIFTPRKRDVLKDALCQSEMVFSVSQEKIRKIRKWMPDVVVNYVPNGIDMDEWVPSKSEKEYAVQWKAANCPEKLCIGLFGHLKPKKGSDFLVEALSKTGLPGQAHLLLVGENTPELENSLEEAGISFTLMPFLDRYELLKYYLCCDAVAIPSFYDGMPNVMLEAGALGIPVIASDVDGMLDLIDHDKNGILFRAGNLDHCRKMFYYLFSLTVEKRSDLGTQLQSKIEKHYTSDHEISAYQEYII